MDRSQVENSVFRGVELGAPWVNTRSSARRSRLFEADLKVRLHEYE